MALDRPARSCYLLRRRKKWKTIRDKYPPARNGRRFRAAGERTPLGLDRRKFLGALGGATAAAAFLGSEGARVSGQSPNPPPPVLYEDSFGNILPCSSDTVAAGIYPPPIPGQGAN